MAAACFLSEVLNLDSEYRGKQICHRQDFLSQLMVTTLDVSKFNFTVVEGTSIELAGLID